VKWFGADDQLAESCFQYMLPISLFCFFNFLYMLACGVAMACGRSIIFGSAQVATFLLKAAVLDPLFLVALKWPIWGASLATILSETIMGVILTVWIWFSDGFSLHCNLRMFVSKPTPETWTGLKVGFPAFINNMSYSVPLVLTQKYLNMAATAVGAYETVVAVWAVVQKLEALAYGICIAFSTGFVPAASYGFGAKRLNRVLWLFVHATWMGTICSSLITSVIVFLPGKVALIWGSDPSFVSWCEECLPKAFYTCLLVGYQYTASALLQALHFVGAASALSVLTMLLPWPTFSSILYFTGKEDPARIMWTYCLNDGFSVIVTTLFLIKPAMMLWSAPPDALFEDRKEVKRDESDGESGSGETSA
jgi:Na+-driven multidrug efflux pump